MGVQVGFSYSAWLQLFPEFQGRVSQVQGNLYFSLASQFHRNDGGGPVSDSGTQTNLLNLLTAHIAQLFAPASVNGTTPGRDPSVVGRITNASEGSVSVATEMPSNPNAGWFYQTAYGTMYWEATKVYRTMRFIPGPRRLTNPWNVGRYWWG